MMKTILNQVGRHAAHAVVGGRLQGSRFNMKLGFALMRDRRISFWSKLIALAIGGVGAAAIVALELPVESILAIVLPGLGLALDYVADGMEAVIIPFVLAALALPFVAPRHLVDEIMQERAGVGEPALAPPPAV